MPLRSLLRGRGPNLQGCHVYRAAWRAHVSVSRVAAVSPWMGWPRVDCVAVLCGYLRTPVVFQGV